MACKARYIPPSVSSPPLGSVTVSLLRNILGREVLPDTNDRDENFVPVSLLY